MSMTGRPQIDWRPMVTIWHRSARSRQSRLLITAKAQSALLETNCPSRWLHKPLLCCPDGALCALCAGRGQSLQMTKWGWGGQRKAHVVISMSTGRQRPKYLEPLTYPEHQHPYLSQESPRKQDRMRSCGGWGTAPAERGRILPYSTMRTHSGGLEKIACWVERV